MLSVFIGFGGQKAEGVAKQLETFLNDEKIETFLASPLSRAILANAPDFPAEINKRLLSYDIIVFVCDKGTPRNDPVKKEINLLYRRHLENKIIPFSASDNCLPKRLRGKRWHPLHFPPEKAVESFPRLLNNIYRSYIDLTPKPTGRVPEGAPMVRQ
jgi:hypothetical protein